jgi:hypothetical protein
MAPLTARFESRAARRRRPSCVAGCARATHGGATDRRSIRRLINCDNAAYAPPSPLLHRARRHCRGRAPPKEMSSRSLKGPAAMRMRAMTRMTIHPRLSSGRSPRRGAQRPTESPVSSSRACKHPLHMNKLHSIIARGKYIYRANKARCTLAELHITRARL